MSKKEAMKRHHAAGERRGYRRGYRTLEEVLALVGDCHDRVRGHLSIMEPQDEKLMLLAAKVVGVDMRDNGEFATLHEIGAVLQFADSNAGAYAQNLH